MTAASLGAELDDPPGWLAEFAAHAAVGYAPARAVALITGLGRLLADGGSRHPQALLERSRQPGRSPGALARVLEDFFTARGLALPLDQAVRLAATRRQRCVDAVPGPLRPAAAAFAQTCLQSRERARRAGTRPRSDDTIERRLSILRDMAIFLAAERGKRDWATADVRDIETFLAARPAGRPKHLTALHRFFAWAKASKLVLTDPTRGLTARQPRGYHGPTATLALQRHLFRRWTTDSAIHPHEALTGLLTLIHGASSEELRGLAVADTDPASHTIRLGRRPQPTPLDPATWAAVERCLTCHDQLHTANPHLLVTRKTKATRAAASEDYPRLVLRPAGVTPRLLRCTRLAELTTSTDPKLVSAAFGIHPQAATHYLADQIDPGRWSLSPEPPTRAVLPAVPAACQRHHAEPGHPTTRYTALAGLRMRTRLMPESPEATSTQRGQLCHAKLHPACPHSAQASRPGSRQRVRDQSAHSLRAGQRRSSGNPA